MKILILGVNGFIGSALAQMILRTTDWSILGVDLRSTKLKTCLQDDRFEFERADIRKHVKLLDHQIRKCDVVVPLVAIATPETYVRDPLAVFELNVLANLKVIQLAAKHGKRIIYASSSEVYGKCPDQTFTEYASNLVLGPIHKQRWIYACGKQMLDRVVYAYGASRSIDFTIFRLFNPIGPRLDDVLDHKEGSSRVLSQFIKCIQSGSAIKLVDGGSQRRCFCWVDEAIDCIIRIIANEKQCASRRVFNIGNPANECSMRDLAMKLMDFTAKTVPLITVTGEEFYGAGYEDLDHRKPNIYEAQCRLGWNPVVGLDEALMRTVQAFPGNGS